MTSRERQLLLELLLLAERYSSSEIRETAKVLKKFSIASDFLRAFESAALSGSHSMDDLASVEIESRNKDATLTIEEFIDQLGSPASLKSRRRISFAAKRLLIPDEGRETADLLQLYQPPYALTVLVQGVVAMERMRSGWSISQFQAVQQRSTMVS